MSAPVAVSQRLEQQRFLDRHLHLIVPPLFTPAQRIVLDQKLLRERWDAYTSAVGNV